MTEGALSPRPLSSVVIRPRSQELGQRLRKWRQELAGAICVPRAGSPFCLSCEIWAPAAADLLFSRSLSLSLDPWFSAKPDFILPVPATNTPGKFGNIQRHFLLSQLGQCYWYLVGVDPRCRYTSRTQNYPTLMSVMPRLRNSTLGHCCWLEVLFSPFLLHCRTEM